MSLFISHAVGILAAFPMAWNVEQILALAPDPSSAKAGKDLSAARKWKTLGLSAACAWGSVQGSGKDPYQTCIDLAEPAFKCTCPSRKFPCKHGLGLGLILAQQPAALTETEPPALTFTPPLASAVTLTFCCALRSILFFATTSPRMLPVASSFTELPMIPESPASMSPRLRTAA